MKNILEKFTRSTNLKALIYVGVLVIGFALGLVWGWVVQPVEWADADPSYLSGSYKEDYFRMVVDSYRVNFNGDLAKTRIDALNTDVEGMYNTVGNDPGTVDPAFLLLFGKFLSEQGYFPSEKIPFEQNAETSAGTVDGTTVIETEGAGSAGLSVTFVIVASIFAVGLAVFGIYTILRRRSRSFEDEYDDDYEDVETEHIAQERRFATPLRGEHAQSQRPQPRASSQTGSEKQPFARFQATYLIGNDDFNESYSIDSRNGEYLGECGFGVSEFMGVGTPKKASAFEVWMFDKNDIQTVTKVLLTPFLFSDHNSRARLEPKGELVEVKPGKQIRLETATLFMIATIKDMKFGEGISAEKSYLDQISMDLSIWQK